MMSRSLRFENSISTPKSLSRSKAVTDIGSLLSIGSSSITTTTFNIPCKETDVSAPVAGKCALQAHLERFPFLGIKKARVFPGSFFSLSFHADELLRRSSYQYFYP